MPTCEGIGDPFFSSNFFSLYCGVLQYTCWKKYSGNFWRELDYQDLYGSLDIFVRNDHQDWHRTKIFNYVLRLKWKQSSRKNSSHLFCWKNSNSITTDPIVIMQVATSIKVVLKPGQQCISIKLDMDLIESLHIGICAESVRHSILNHPKIKLKEQVKYSQLFFLFCCCCCWKLLALHSQALPFFFFATACTQSRPRQVENISPRSR